MEQGGGCWPRMMREAKGAEFFMSLMYYLFLCIKDFFMSGADVSMS